MNIGVNSAYVFGFLSAQKGDPSTKNPYGDGCVSYNDWLDGYKAFQSLVELNDQQEEDRQWDEPAWDDGYDPFFYFGD